MLFRLQKLFLLGGDWSDHNNGGHWGNNSNGISCESCMQDEEPDLGWNDLQEM